VDETLGHVPHGTARVRESSPLSTLNATGTSISCRSGRVLSSTAEIDLFEKLRSAAGWGLLQMRRQSPRYQWVHCHRRQAQLRHDLGAQAHGIDWRLAGRSLTHHFIDPPKVVLCQTLKFGLRIIGFHASA